jgi:hypothetical protein
VDLYVYFYWPDLYITKQEAQSWQKYIVCF